MHKANEFIVVDSEKVCVFVESPFFGRSHMF